MALEAIPATWLSIDTASICYLLALTPHELLSDYPNKNSTPLVQAMLTVCVQVVQMQLFHGS